MVHHCFCSRMQLIASKIRQKIIFATSNASDSAKKAEFVQKRSEEKEYDFAEAASLSF